MEIKKFEFNPFPENTYVVWDKDTKEGIIIDAGCYYTDEKESFRLYTKQRYKYKALVGNAFTS